MNNIVKKTEVKQNVKKNKNTTVIKKDNIKNKKKTLRVCNEVLELKDLPLAYEKFILDIPQKAVRTSKLEDGTKYTLYGYQFIVNRLNDVIGFEHWDIKLLTEPVIEQKNNIWFVSLSLRLSLGNWEIGGFKPLVSKPSFGNGTSDTLGNAKKGALTNGFKTRAKLHCSTKIN